MRDPDSGGKAAIRGEIANWMAVHQQMMVTLAPSLPTALLEFLAAAARAQVVRSDFGAVTAYRFLARERRFE
jgi:hypothetical protein